MKPFSSYWQACRTALRSLALAAALILPAVWANAQTSFYDNSGNQKYAKEGVAGLPVQLYTLDASGTPQPLRIGTTNVPVELPDSAMVGATLTKSTKTSAYALGQIVAQSATAGSCSPLTLAIARANDKSGMVRRVRVSVNDTAWLNMTVRVHFFRDSPTFTNGDGANFAGGLSESVYIGAADVVLDQQFSDPKVKGIGAPNAGGEINFIPSAGTQNVFVVLESRSATGTVAASSSWNVVAETLRN